ncbi:MAG: phosphatidylglycerophosphatase A [Alphaproteobacteria bacterium]|nr:phosphatidylglycerophosphatase A [Alphaproteobacteria bacterium]
MSTLKEKLKQKISEKSEQRRHFIKGTRPTSIEFQIATWFGSGLIIPAPGTWGTVGGFVFGCLLMAATTPVITFLMAIALTIVGYFAIRKIEGRFQEHDSSFIVIDEVIAILFVLSLLPTFTPLFSVLGFILFRIFDAVKPWPINWLDKQIGGATGVIVDDLMAGLYTLLILWGIYGYGLI